ncbi:MAG: 5-(carboxyamino)imidazole ribonucleotide synthase [Flavobacteriales bacterium]|nr:5-(carboxyamino)imidazole ribonucleotide synthase [Flavobacteriales bacterium]
MTQPFKKRIGIIGGGQLGKMLAEAGMPLNIEYNILESSTDAPAARYATTFIKGNLTDGKKIRELAKISDVLTFEIEHIDVETLLELEKAGKEIIPSPRVLSIIKDKGVQKSFYEKHQLATSAFLICDVEDAPKQDLNQFGGDKIVVKSCTGGYDGKGVAILNKTDVEEGGAASIFSGEVVLEEFVENAIELSVIVAQNSDGQTKTYPAVEMVFDPKINLVDYLFSPSKQPNSVIDEAEKLALKAVEALSGAGVFAVELFVDSHHRCFINEIAPRPHNSGHHTIEANITSQYEQLNRILLGLPLGETTLLSPAVMTNLLGSEGVSGQYELDGLEELAQTPGAYLHWYNKSETKPGRKMGHFTVLDKDLEKAIQKSIHLKELLKTVAQ